MYKIILSPRAIKDIKKLTSPIRKGIDRTFLKLKENPRISNFKLLQDSKLADFRVRVGDHRILYDVYEKEKVIYVFRIGHRKDIYK